MQGRKTIRIPAGKVTNMHSRIMHPRTNGGMAPSRCQLTNLTKISVFHKLEARILYEQVCGSPHLPCDTGWRMFKLTPLPITGFECQISSSAGRNGNKRNTGYV